MQRWIVVGVLAMMLICGGGAYGVWNYRQNRPAERWVELPINPDRSDDERERTAKLLLEKLRDKDLLAKVCKDLSVAGTWGMNSDSEAAEELSKRVFVRIGETGPPMGRIPAVHIGVRGKWKEIKLSDQISTRLMDDVWKILGMKPPTHQ
ncbi:MAG: hypothetical protein ABIS50_06650 [Luteolibacter sp.]|uniref:hypothetical protein n=1 Tax=Luteolibacter sp. TaxID=1962973 RepID=UPI003267A6FD